MSGSPEIPKATPWGPSETFLECRPDGVVQVKDGRSLDEYINDPRLCERRKHDAAEGNVPMIISTAKTFEMGLMPRCA